MYELVAQIRQVSDWFKDRILFRVLQFLILCLGISFFVWAYTDPRFRDAEGFLTGGFCLPVSVGVGLMLLGCAVAGQLKKAAFWFALALVGQAVALQMIEAGSAIRYQHFKPMHRLLAESPLLLFYFGVQTALVITGLIRRWPNIKAWFARTFRTWQVLGTGLLFFLTSATVSREVSAYVFELVFAALVQAMNLGSIVLMVWALPDNVLALLRQRIELLLGQPGGGSPGGPVGVDRFAFLAAVWVAVLAAVLNIFSYERHPHLADEVVYLLHARYLAEGMLTLPAPPVPDAFNVDLMYYAKDRWWSPVPPGWPAILTLGVLLGVPWLINPLLAGLNVLLTYVLLSEIYDRRAARLAVVLLCVSPWHVFMAMNFMNHTFTLTCALAAAVAVVWARRTGKAMWAGLGGGAVGLVSLIRPLDGLVVAAFLGLWSIGLGGLRLKASSIGALVLGTMLMGSVVFPYNKWLTGNPTISPMTAYTDKYYGPKTNALGFGPERGLGWPIDPFPGHSLPDVIVNANLNISSVNIELFGWSTGSLIMIAVLVFSKAIQRRDYLMLAVIAMVFGAYSLYWFSGGPDFGARYWYLMLIPSVALTVRGIEVSERIFTQNSIRVMVVVLSLSLLTLVNYFPWRAIDKYHHYLGMRPDIRHIAKKYDFGKSLVLIRGERYPDYASAAVFNPLDLWADAPVYAWDKNPKKQAQVLNAYPDRPVWIVNGPSITHAGFEVVQGPLSGYPLISP